MCSTVSADFGGLMIQVIVVGGPADVFRKFKHRLQEKGLDASWHWEWKKTRRKRRNSRLPKSVEGVVILKSMISHSLRNRAIALAKATGVPYVEVEPNSKAMSSIDLIFNSDSLVRVSSDRDVSAKSKEEIVNPRPIFPLPKKIELETPRSRVPNTSLLERVQDDATPWAELILEERPELILDIEAFRTKLVEVADFDVPRETAANILRTLKQRWQFWGTRVDHHSPDFRDSKDRVNLIKQTWLTRYLESFEPSDMPTHAVVKARALVIFGSKFQNNVIRQAKLDRREPDCEEGCPVSVSDTKTQGEPNFDKLVNAQPPQPKSTQADFEHLNQKVRELTAAVAVLAQRVNEVTHSPASKMDVTPSWMSALKTLSDLGLKVEIGVTGTFVPEPEGGSK